MAEFTVQDGRLDVRLSVFCGQVFRWKELPDGRMVGADGDNWWIVAQEGEKICVESNADRLAFESYFRVGEDWVSYGDQVRAAVPEIGPFMDLLPGLRLLQPSDPVEEMFCFLCTSNNHLSRIKAMVDVLAGYGPPMLVIDGLGIHRFPSLERIAGIEESELRGQGFGYRAATIPKAARQILDRGGEAWLHGLKQASYEDARTSLLQLAGVGPKLADCICLFALGHTEAVPVDTHVWQAAARLWFPQFAGKSLTEGRYRDVAGYLRDRLGPLAGWAHQFLFYENLLNWRKR